MRAALPVLTILSLWAAAGCGTRSAEASAETPKGVPAVEVSAEPQNRITGVPTARAVGSEIIDDSIKLFVEIQPNMRDAKVDETNPLDYQITGGKVESVRFTEVGRYEILVKRTGAGRIAARSLRYAEGSPQNPNALAVQGNWSWDSPSGSGESSSKGRARRKKKTREVTVDDVWDGKTIKDSIPPP